MNLNFKIVLALGMFWIVQTTEAQTADSTILTPPDLRVGPPPKRGAPPVRKAAELDPTANSGKVEWSERNIEFDTLQQGNPKVKEISFRNISKKPLRIEQVKSSCHCTVPEWPQTPIPPGGTGIIKVMHTAEDLGEFYRILSIQTNFDPENWVLITVTGVVK